MKYFQNRQNPLQDHSDDEMELIFHKISDWLGYEWLSNKNGNNVIQELWNRKDALSTNELYTFGNALIAAEKLNPIWLKSQIKLVKQKDENNQKGAAFEILAVGYLNSKQTVIPAPANQKGYDIDAITENSNKYRISLKCYSQSTNEKQFRNKSETARKKLIQGMTSSTKNAQIYIEALTFPAENDWQLLYSKLSSFASHYDGSRIIEKIENVWIVGILPLYSNNSGNCAAGKFSHTFICVSPYHKNEQNNFISKIDSAVSNLEKYVDVEHGHIPIIIFRLPPTASAMQLKEWAEKYFNDNRSTILNGIIFIQPYFTIDEKSSSNYISYYTSSVFPKTNINELQFEIPVGVGTNQPPLWQLKSDSDKRSLMAEYVYQYGEHYVSPVKEGNCLKGKINNFAPGIKTYLVVELNGSSTNLSVHFGDDVCLVGG